MRGVTHVSLEEGNSHCRGSPPLQLDHFGAAAGKSRAAATCSSPWIHSCVMTHLPPPQSDRLPFSTQGVCRLAGRVLLSRGSALAAPWTALLRISQVAYDAECVIPTTRRASLPAMARNAEYGFRSPEHYCGGPKRTVLVSEDPSYLSSPRGLQRLDLLTVVRPSSPMLLDSIATATK